MSSKSPRGPLPAFGGPPSKTNYVCKICEKEVRRDRIREHYGAYVDMDVLNQPDASTRAQALARLPVEKRKHTERVKDFFFSNKKLPLDYKNLDYWTKAAQNKVGSFQNIFAVKRKNNVEGEQPPKKKQTTNDEPVEGDMDSREELESSNSVTGVEASIQVEEEIEIAQDALEILHPALDLEEHTLIENISDNEETGTKETRTKGTEAKEAETKQAGTKETETKDTIREALIEALKDPEAAEMLAEQIAIKLKKLQEKERDSETTESYWIRGEDFVSCSYCIKYSGIDQVPAALRKFKKGNFGRILLNNEQFHIKRSQKVHESNDLHKWCMMKGKILEEEAFKEDKKNEKAAENTVRNVLFALMNGGGSELFVGLMDKDNLTDGIDAPTKNDSKKTFFDLRDIISEEVNKRVKAMFKEVRYITVTLDKVTVGHVSYMVILTYFFHKGRIHICLNSLEKMQETDYDGPGTAQCWSRF